MLQRSFGKIFESINNVSTISINVYGCPYTKWMVEHKKNKIQFGEPAHHFCHHSGEKKKQAPLIKTHFIFFEKKVIPKLSNCKEMKVPFAKKSALKKLRNCIPASPNLPRIFDGISQPGRSTDLRCSVHVRPRKMETEKKSCWKYQRYNMI